MITWQQLETAAPQIAQVARQQFDGLRVALLGTIRVDGSPRISPVEPYFSQGHLLFGAMTWSHKSRDLLRDPRCVLHSAVTAPDAGDPEVKLYGRAVEATTEIREGCSAGWWQTRPDAAVVFVLAVDRATSIEWNLHEGQMLVRHWSPGHGLTETRRSYP
jgi:Pyridoxamine 5'-phosphate oxidase